MNKILILFFVIFVTLSVVCFVYPGAIFGAYFFGALAILSLILFICNILYDFSFFRVLSIVLKVCFVIWIISFVVIQTFIANGKQDDEVDADVLIVLGAGVNYDIVSYSFRLRLDKAYEYLIEHPETIVITTGGKTEGDKYSEGYAAEQYLRYRGIEKDRVLYEETSTNTYQNIQNAKELLPEDFDGTAMVVSNSFHLYRARSLMEIFELTPYALGSDLGEQYPFLEIIYNIREYFSIVKHYIFEKITLT